MSFSPSGNFRPSLQRCYVKGGGGFARANSLSLLLPISAIFCLQCFSPCFLPFIHTAMYDSWHFYYMDGILRESKRDFRCAHEYCLRIFRAECCQCICSEYKGTLGPVRLLWEHMLPNIDQMINGTNFLGDFRTPYRGVKFSIREWFGDASVGASAPQIWQLHL